MKRPNFFEFWSDLFFKPQDFFSKNLADSNQRPNYFALSIFIFGTSFGIDRLDRQFVRYDLNGKLDRLDALNNWIGYWIFAIIVGTIGGYIFYLVGGWFFNLRLKWSKGTGNIDKSRYIFLYSGVIPGVVVIATTIVSMLIMNKPYETETAFGLWELASFVILLLSLYYSVYVSYSGVRTITDAEKSRSKFWFLVLPFIAYTLAYLTVYASIFYLKE